MQFDPVTERCIHHPMSIRSLAEPQRSEMIAWLRKFKAGWLEMRELYGL